MSIPKRFTLPDIDRDGLTPQELALLAFVEELVDVGNRLQEDVQRLEKEAVRLRSSTKRA
jgi:hypothetical protein